MIVFTLREKIEKTCERMKILINGTTIVVGGGLQVTRSLIVEFAGNSHGHVIKIGMPFASSVKGQQLSEDRGTRVHGNSPPGMFSGGCCPKWKEAI